MFTITKTMVSDGVYNGPEIGVNDTVVVSPDIPLIRFMSFLDAKGMTYTRSTEVYLGKGGRIRHLKCGGTIASNGDLLAGSVEASSAIIVNGDLVTWLGDMRSTDGNICVTGDMRSAGSVIAPDGAIAVSGTIERDGRIHSLDTWFGASGKPLSVMAKSAAAQAEKTLMRLSGAS